ncbi:ribonuclease H-like domain-containing protein [Tanacetum coccineum]|uniref:Ribonuclease H-like domain-containing protein n=1 Tax=Tanacetum coccineum TaxID=301880 RepID=A0ABQ5B254_9ASTR
MDTGVSSHLNSSVTSLSDIFNTCMYPSISVGDGNSIPVTNTDHSILPTPTTLHLNNVLITPHIVKNLIYIRQFVRDNNCTVEFDAFGFSVKDFMTRRVLLRCDSTGDLYPVTTPSPIPQALLVSQHMWHQRLGHPGSKVLRVLFLNNFISYNKDPVLCHACQHGKHVRLPFVSSNTVVTSCFDIVHSDVWTLPILSLSGYKYYVLFLDHYSQFVWVYPLLHKSDVLSKFTIFRSYVHTQFKCEIQSFQCDHGGEFDNRNLHKLFADNEIQFRFSCPHTSQQNGKSERMVRTINNLIRTLLFQANQPLIFWVEALNMAVHLLNILPSTAINSEIPYTRLFGTNPDYSLLRTFGCLCYPHLYPNHKLEPRATPAILLGYASNHHRYCFLDLTTNKISLSHHVTFDEIVFPYGTVKPTSAPAYNFLDDSPDIIPQVIPTVHLPHTPNTDLPTDGTHTHEAQPTNTNQTQNGPAHLASSITPAHDSPSVPISLITHNTHTSPFMAHHPHEPSPNVAAQSTNLNPA